MIHMLQLFISIKRMLSTAQKYVFLPALYPSSITLNIKCVGSTTASETLFFTDTLREARSREALKGAAALVGRADGQYCPSAHFSPSATSDPWRRCLSVAGRTAGPSSAAPKPRWSSKYLIWWADAFRCSPLTTRLPESARGDALAPRPHPAHASAAFAAATQARL